MLEFYLEEQARSAGSRSPEIQRQRRAEPSRGERCDRRSETPELELMASPFTSPMASPRSEWSSWASPRRRREPEVSPGATEEEDSDDSDVVVVSVEPAPRRAELLRLQLNDEEKRAREQELRRDAAFLGIAIRSAERYLPQPAATPAARPPAETVRRSQMEQQRNRRAAAEARREEERRRKEERRHEEEARSKAAEKAQREAALNKAMMREAYAALQRQMEAARREAEAHERIEEEAPPPPRFLKVRTGLFSGPAGQQHPKQVIHITWASGPAPSEAQEERKVWEEEPATRSNARDPRQHRRQAEAMMAEETASEEREPAAAKAPAATATEAPTAAATDGAAATEEAAAPATATATEIPAAATEVPAANTEVRQSSCPDPRAEVARPQLQRQQSVEEPTGENVRWRHVDVEEWPEAVARAVEGTRRIGRRVKRLVRVRYRVSASANQVEVSVEV
ncbi:vicilin-like seed storage protein At2g18540 [Drosophila obscura]|uniref:vicilin-like seed storage protein At2g18540 n=1 Tax=Drosophila obscura TaxID=7282 RepID=UPI001BB18C16|nr:vicilin-like seed storage protein At2g18540 [Drosophila obscura]